MHRVLDRCLKAEVIIRCQAEYVRWPISQCPNHELLEFDDRNADLTSSVSARHNPTRRLHFMARSEHEMQGECYEPHHMMTAGLISKLTGRGQIPIFRESVCGGINGAVAQVDYV